jgi:carbon-monoxide dehydrogenase large subunit
MIHSKDGSPMNMGDWRPLAQDQGALCRRCGRHRRRRHQGPGARRRREGRCRLRGTAGRWSRPSTRSRTARRNSSDNAPGNLIYDWEIGDAAAADAAIASAAHVTRMEIVNNRLVPNPMEPRAALGHYDEAEDHYTLWTTSQNPHVARLVMSAFYNVAPENKLRVIAPDVGGGFGSKIYIYPEEIVCLWASKKTGVPVKWVADRTEASSPMRMAATMSRRSRWPLTPTTRSLA